MLIITPADFKKLSISCQRELIALLGFTFDGIEAESDEFMPNEYIPENCLYDTDYSSNQFDQEIAYSSKQVIDISYEQAKELIANISVKSIETLKIFARGEPVTLSSLIGEGRSYSNLTELKRSFVGAVNRRLRTVTGNRRAVLFLTVSQEDTHSGVRIAVRQETANSILKVFQDDRVAPKTPSPVQ